MKTKALALGLLAAASMAPAHADNYNFIFRNVAGQPVSSGSLSTGSTVNTVTYGGFTYQSNTVLTMNGLFMGGAIAFVPNPFAPAAFQHGNITGNNQLAFSGPGLLDGYGLVFDTINGPANIGGDLIGPNQYGYFAVYNDGTRNRSLLGTFEVTQVAGNTAVAGGTAAAPVALTSQVTGIAGSIGPTNPEQFYTFDWAGGFFSSTANIGNAAASDIFAFSLAGYGNATPFQRQSVLLNTGNSFNGTLSFNLAAGRYMLGLNGVVPIDPDFTISFNTAVGGAPVPEPATWSMMIAGFLGMGAALRRRRILERSIVA
jgi:hypothetical protein